MSLPREIPLRFHWRLLQGGEIEGKTRVRAAASRETGRPDLEAQVEFCRLAETFGIRGMLVDVGAAKPDPIVLSTAIGLATNEIELIIAYRSGLIMPTTFVQQLNTLSAMIGGRIILNIVAGHSPLEQRFYGDLLDSDTRYARTDEFLAICRAFWEEKGPVNFEGAHFKIENGLLNSQYVSPHRKFPEIFVAGGSANAQKLALSQGTLWMQMADAPEVLAPKISPMLAAGKSVGLRMSVMARSTRKEAIDAAYGLVENLDPAQRERDKERALVRESDSVTIRANYEESSQSEWPMPWLFTGPVRTHGPAAVTLVGSPDDIADALMQYRQIGVSQFILSGWPKRESMIFFGEEILPRVQAKERKLSCAVPKMALSAG